MPVNLKNVLLTRSILETNTPDGSFVPTVYIVEITNICNVRCIMCPTHKISATAKGHMSEVVFDKVLGQIAPFAELTMLYFMGEPTLHPEFCDIMAQARKRLRGKIVVSTNLNSISDDIARALIDNSDIIIACIDRWNASSYEQVRRGASFETAVEQTEKLLSLRGASQTPTIIVKALDITFAGELLEARDSEMRDFAEYWHQKGAVPLAGWLNTWAGQMPGLAQLAREATPYSATPRTPCADLWFKAVINWRGDVVMCCHDWAYSNVMGSLLDMSLQDIWHSPRLIRLRSMHSSGEFGAHPMCATCAEWGMPDELDAYMRLAPDDLYRVF